MPMQAWFLVSCITRWYVATDIVWPPDTMVWPCSLNNSVILATARCSCFLLVPSCLHKNLAEVYHSKLPTLPPSKATKRAMSPTHNRSNSKRVSFYENVRVVYYVTASKCFRHELFYRKEDFDRFRRDARMEIIAREREILRCKNDLLQKRIDELRRGLDFRSQLPAIQDQTELSVAA